MYRKESGRWYKHTDFIVLDMICLQLSFILAYAVAGYGGNVYHQTIYRYMAVFLELSDVITILLFSTMHDVLKRGYYKEFLITLNHACVVGASTVIVLFCVQQGQIFSRLTLGLTVILYLWISYIIRLLWKKHLKAYVHEERSLFIITSDDIKEQTADTVLSSNYSHYVIPGMAILDTDRTGTKVQGITVTAASDTVVDYVCHNWVDEVLIVLSDSQPYPSKLIEQLSETGVIVHFKLAIKNIPGKRQLVEKIGGYTVLTTTVNTATPGQIFMKRLIDIVGGLAGCVFTGIIFIFVAPAIYIASPGPIFYTQDRIGQNGRKFKIYKFRSMYMDADKRKAELMKENKISDGKMFKMDFDPRVIGNKILPDGSHKTGIGDFIRRTSLDEFPQFFNVLKGEMSIVGTRPPLPSEVALYEPQHFVRLAAKPGITGMWQVSGRSNITDFDEVVRLDKEYIETWNIGLDIKIMLKTVKAVLKHEGSM